MVMNKIPINEVTSAGQATDIAIEWQDWQHEQDLSYGEIAAWQNYFADLADRFPELREEFEENAII